MTSIQLPAGGWRPRPHQQRLWDYLEGGGRRAIAIWHRRAGKDEVCLHWTCVAAHLRPATYWHMLPEYEQGRKAIWSAVNPATGRRRIDEAFPRELRSATNEQGMFIRFRCGATWQVVGSDRYDAAVGSSPAGIVFSEWALSNPAAWPYLAPILAENGGWAAFITTSRGRNHAHSMLESARRDPSWFAEVLPVSASGVIAAETIERERGEYRAIYGEDAGDALIEQEYNCSFSAAVLGSYFGKQLAQAEGIGRIGAVEVEPRLPVHTAWDIGVDDPVAMWCFQIVPSDPDGAVIHVVDFYEASGEGFDHYWEWVCARGYHGVAWVPHDAKAREIGAPGARTRIETMLSLGFKARLQPQAKLMDGVNAARKTIPLCRFDAERCKKGLDALHEYKAAWDQFSRTFAKTPAHNWASHAADAFRGLSLSWREPVEEEAEPMRSATEMTMEEAWRLARARQNDVRS